MDYSVSPYDFPFTFHLISLLQPTVTQKGMSTLSCSSPSPHQANHRECWFADSLHVIGCGELSCLFFFAFICGQAIKPFLVSNWQRKEAKIYRSRQLFALILPMVWACRILTLQVILPFEWLVAKVSIKIIIKFSKIWIIYRIV